MAALNDLLKFIDINESLFNKADNKLIFVIEQLIKKFQFAVKNSVFKSELNLIIATFIIALLLFVLDPLGKKQKATAFENRTPEPIPEIEKKIPSEKSAVKEDIKEEVTIDGNKKQTKVVYGPLDEQKFEAFISELRNPGFEVTRIKKDKSYKKILRLNNEGMLYWSKENKIFGKHPPWKPESFCGTEQNRSAGTFTLKFNSSTGIIDYVLKIEGSLSPEQLIKGLSDLAVKKVKDKSFATKIPSTPSKGKFSKPEAETAIVVPAVSPVKEEETTGTTVESPSTPTRD